jgi:hypothetical protein
MVQPSSQRTYFCYACGIDVGDEAAAFFAKFLVLLRGTSSLLLATLARRRRPLDAAAGARLVILPSLVNASLNLATSSKPDSTKAS